MGIRCGVVRRHTAPMACAAVQLHVTWDERQVWALCDAPSDAGHGVTSQHHMVYAVRSSASLCSAAHTDDAAGHPAGSTTGSTGSSTTGSTTSSTHAHRVRPGLRLRHVPPQGRHVQHAPACAHHAPRSVTRRPRVEHLACGSSGTQGQTQIRGQTWLSQLA